MTKKISKGPPNFGGHTLQYWDELWERLEGGFGIEHRKVYGQVGLYRAVLHDRVVFIGSSQEMNMRLQQLRSKKDLKSNSHYGARKIREHINELQLEVLLLGRGAAPKLFVGRLKFAMIRESRPIWNQRQASFRKDGA